MTQHQVTISYDDDDLDRAIQRAASAFDTTKDGAALILIRRAAGLEVAESRKRIGSSLKKYVGLMTEEDRRRVEESVAEHTPQQSSRRR